MMALGAQSTCPHCSTALTGDEAQCPACGTSLGAPNVRACSVPTELSALEVRAKAAEGAAAQRGCLDAAQAFVEKIKTESGVVVSLPSIIARQMLSAPNTVYQTYETLVDSGTRTAATPDNDRMRRSVGGLLFGSYAPEIRYGVLSINNLGPSSYGEISFRLRDVTVQHRVTFMEWNSYKFVEQHQLSPGKEIPKGYRSLWQNRDQLALSKLGPHLSSGQNATDWAALLLQSAGDRSTDDFIEAHIFGPFNASSIQSVTYTPTKNASKESKLDARIALQLFQKRNKGAVPTKGSP